MANDLTRHGEAQGFMKMAYADFARPAPDRSGVP